MNPPALVERARSARHYDDLARLQRLTLPHDKPYDPRKAAWWIAYIDGAPAAFGGITTSRQWADCMYLCRAGVAPAYRGHGLQRRMIWVREAHARRVGATWVVTDTTDNPPSSNSLIACGYRLFDPSRPWGGRTTLYWRKRIA